MAKIKLNPEVYRAAAKLLHRRRKWYSCHAIEKAVSVVGRKLPSYDDRADMAYDHKSAFTKMFATAGHAEYFLDKDGHKARTLKAVSKESGIEHPFWNIAVWEDKEHTARRQRITALLMMADLVEAGATF